ncbi:hypothetical protein [Saccharopolyspora spinosa]|uniref:hypothetical protein n=1 Tax=Saccharopolyspora spinosa TaxID=60894 RepID=UPI003BA9896E
MNSDAGHPLLLALALLGAVGTIPALWALSALTTWWPDSDAQILWRARWRDITRPLKRFPRLVAARSG